MIIKRYDRIKYILFGDHCEAVRIAVGNLMKDFDKAMDVASTTDSKCASAVITIENEAKGLPREGYEIKADGNGISIKGADRRGTIYGIYTLSEMLGVSPWTFMADVPVLKKETFELADGFMTADHPVIEYRGIFINDEEELDKWVSLHMDEPTIGVKTYEKIFELLLRLKLNYIWPAMHVNSFNVLRENGELADRMGIVVGTSHCDMLMRSNNREWVPWLKKKGYKDVEYDWSIPGKNRKILKEYWAESVDQNKDFEVSYTVGMRGIHDSGFEVRKLEGLTGTELLNAKTALLEEVIEAQEKIIKERVPGESLKLFVPYKEVLELYDNGLKVPEDVTLVWVNDNYGYVRRYPGEKEKLRAGGNGIYYHNSYWAPAGNSYMFVNTIPLAHTANELKKAYAEGIGKLWVTNFGTLKPFEEEMSYFADLAWETGKEGGITENTDLWLENWIKKTFGESIEEDAAEELAELLNDFDQVSNVRKVEHLEPDVFLMNGYGDEGAHRLHFYEKIFVKANRIWEGLPAEQKDAFFELILMKIHAVYYSHAMFYYADRSYLCEKHGKLSAAKKYTALSMKFDLLRKQMISYYNNVMAEGKWSGILTPEDFPPPRTGCCPACVPPLRKAEKKLIVTTWSGDNNLEFTGLTTKWIEVSNAGEGGVDFEITAPPWLKLLYVNGRVAEELRILIENRAVEDCSGELLICSRETGDRITVPVSVKTGDEREDDNRIAVEATDLVKKEGHVSIITRLGRDHGSLVQLDDETAKIVYGFTIYAENTDAKLIIHRFPTLNSVGRIRARITLDGKDEYIYEAGARDEHMANWKDNVQNNADTGCPIRLTLTKGYHEIEISGIDKYFSFTRFFILLGEGKPFNTGVPCYCEDLPKEFDTVAVAEKLYGKVTLETPKEIFMTLNKVTNWNADIDEYREAEPAVSPEEWLEESKNAIDRILCSAEKPLGTGFDAAAALAGTEYACINDAHGEISYCNSISHRGLGLAMLIRDKKKRFLPENAPALEYAFEAENKGRYVLWLRMFMWDNKENALEITLDGKRYEGKDFLKPDFWNFNSENAWKWYPTCEADLEAGIHKLSIRFLEGGLRIDGIHFETGRSIWKN